MAVDNTAMEVELYVNSDIDRKTQMRDSDSSDRAVGRLAERHSSFVGVTDCNCKWAAPVADSAEDLCISAIGRSVKDYRDN